MATKDDLLNTYKTQTTMISDAESRLAEIKAQRSATAKQIMDEHGVGPYDIDGKQQIVTQMKGTYFLRVSLQGGKKKSEATA